MRVVGYYCGQGIPIDSFETSRLTHIIFCFGGLKDNMFNIHSAIDSATIKQMVALKKKQPELKVMLSLGGWGGCEHCSDVFSTPQGRLQFAKSVQSISSYFHTDGIDLDWEYPVVKGFPGHTSRLQDRDNFTALLKAIRDVNGKHFEISFAAGGFTTYIDSSINWKEVIRFSNFINIMSYDLVHGYSKVSGHHTPLFSTSQQLESTDHAVQLLLKAGVPSKQIVIGSAFYGRFFKIENGFPVGLYMPCHFEHSFSSKHLNDSITVTHGFTRYWDSTAQAPYAINIERQLLATYDDARSVAAKTNYVKEHHLGGIMFWQLYDDAFHGGLLDVIDKNK